MTQRNQNSHKRLHQSWQRSLPMRSVCWLSSFSLLGNGLVFAQTESAAIDNIVPTATNTQSQAVKKPLKKDIVISTTKIVAKSQSSKPKSTFAQRRARLRQVLKQRASNSQKPAVAAKKPKPRVSVKVLPRNTKTSPIKPAIATKKKPSVRASQPSTAIRQGKPKVKITAPIARPPVSNTRRAVSKPTSIPKVGRAKPSKPKDYNNAYIDPTNYNGATKRNNEAPRVILTERGNGCRAISVKGQGITSSNCVKAPVSNTKNQNIANSQNKPTSKKAPSWLRKSQTSRIASAKPVKRSVVSRVRKSRWRRNRIATAVSSRRWNPTQRTTSVTKSSISANRFIPSPSNFAATQVSATPLAPKGGMLPLPVTADNLAPRPSTVAYNIPLATTLPKIAYGMPNITYGNGRGFMFPVSVPSPITSLFGWRIHPITGNRRFHAGTDIGAAMGTPVLAAYTGQVEVADWVGGYGMTVILNHGSSQQTLYGHMSEIFVRPGQQVEKGMVIGRVGSTGNSTGPHLHFEVRQLTSEGWVATNPNAYLEDGLQQLMQSLRTAQKPE
ncbi:MAG: M23 family metallopeptidase [Calothrix sp. MO_167.B12]|nr:M23 family metallopeptidase [Calothrix sp. MO_167.B12]